MKILLFIRKHPVLTTLLAVIVVVLFLTSRFTLLEVQVNGEQTGVTITNLYKEGKVVKALGQGLNLVGKGAYEVRVESGERASEKRFSAEAYKINRIGIDLKDLSDIKKIASQSKGCIAGEMPPETQTEVLSFTCGYSPNIVSYRFGSQGPVISQRLNSAVYKPTPYNEGLLAFVAGLEHDDRLRLAYIDSDSIQPLPYFVEADIDTASYDIVVSPESNGMFVALNMSIREATVFKSVSDSKPQIIALDESIKNARVAINNKLYIFSPEQSDDLGNVESHPEGGGRMLVYSGNETLSLTENITIPGNISIFDFQVTKDAHIVNRAQDNNIYLYEISGGNLKPYDVIYTANDFVAKNHGLVFIRDSRFYSYSAKDRTSFLEYELVDLSVSYLQNIGGQIIFSALGPGNILYNFGIYESDQNDPVQILSYLDSENYLIDLDYGGKTIYAQLSLNSFTSDHRTGNIIYDEDEFSQKQSQLISKLQSDGIDLREYKLIVK